MRLRIVLTDGMRDEDLCWLKHVGSKVICGLVGDGWHVNYPPDGRVHYTLEEKQNGRKRRVFWPQPGIPLTAFTGMRELLSMKLPPGALTKEPENSKAHAKTRSCLSMFAHSGPTG